MPIQLASGFKAVVVIQDLKARDLYQKSCKSSRELADFILKYSKSKPGWSTFNSLIMPLRTDSWHHFVKDFFLPTFVQYALKSHAIALKLIVLSVALDIVTFPIRFIALPLRVIYNYTHVEQKHPIERDLGIVGHKYVKLCYSEENVVIDPSFQNQQGSTLQIAKKVMLTGEKIVALKTPIRSDGLRPPFSKEKGFINYYLNTNGQWKKTRENVVDDCKAYFEPLYPAYEPLC